METPQSANTVEIRDTLSDLQNRIPEIEDLILLSLDELAERAEREVGYTLDDASLLMYGLADEIDMLKFENPAAKAALVSRIGEMLSSISVAGLDGLDGKTEEESYAAIYKLLSETKLISDTVTSLRNAQSAEVADTEKVTKEISYTVQPDDSHERVIAYMHGVKSVSIAIPDKTTLNRFASALGERKNAFLKDTAISEWPFTFLAARDLDGQFYLSDGKSVYRGMGYVPFVHGMKLQASKEIVATSPESLTAHFKDAKEEQALRIDQMIGNPFVDRAVISYTKESIDRYKIKYPDFPFKTTDTVYLARGNDDKFYFANEQEKLPKDKAYTINQSLPRAFIFEGDILEFDKPVDIIDQGEAADALEHLDEKLNDALNVKEMVKKIEKEFGVHIGYKPEDIAVIQGEYKKRFGENLDALSVMDPHVLKANLDFVYARLGEYGKAFIASSGLTTINVFNNFEYIGRGSESFRDPGAEVIRGGIMTIEDMSAFDHELLHVAENATSKEGEIDSNDWLKTEDEDVRRLIASFQEGHDLADDRGGNAESGEKGAKSAGLADYSLSRRALREELAHTLLKSGAPSLYALIAGEKEADEVQAEIADFLKNDPDAFALISMKDESGNFTYPQLRSNCIRILRFYYEKSGGYIDKAWWERITGVEITDDSLFDFGDEVV